MKMLKIAFSVALLAVVGCACGTKFDPKNITAVSPDGRNVIRLHTDPLAYEVSRDGVVLVAKTPIGLKANGVALEQGAAVLGGSATAQGGVVASPVYKKSQVDLSGNETYVDFGDWGVRLAARNDGVAYRFETAGVTFPSADAQCFFCRTGSYGCEETIPGRAPAAGLPVGRDQMFYLPFVYTVGGKTVAVTESDVHDYPILNFCREGGLTLVSEFARFPKKTQRAADGSACETGGRWVQVSEREDILVETAGSRTFPWRVFVLADSPSKLCESDAVWALATPQAKDADFSWVKPGKVSWDWWNCFDNGAGCNTKTYERFIDFAAANGVEYVIMDEGWSESLNIWKFHPDVDVPHIIKYGAEKGVGIILWMAWAQVYGDEDRVAEHFSKLGAKGFKVDFMDRGDADIGNFLEKFAAACAKNRMIIDYHGVYRPVGMSRKYPNVVNYEGIHGLEQMKWFDGKEAAMMFNDVAAFYLRLTAGPMDYTPGAMINHGIGSGYRGSDKTPGSVGTRCRQMAMMALYEAPLQMLSDSPTLYEKNKECFDFMAKVPTVWQDVVGLGGTPDTMVAAARQTRDGAWYAAAMTTVEARDWTLDTSFLGEGEWTAELFRDAGDDKAQASQYVHETKAVAAGDKLDFHMAPGGGFIVKFAKK